MHHLPKDEILLSKLLFVLYFFLLWEKWMLHPHIDGFRVNYNNSMYVVIIAIVEIMTRKHLYKKMWRLSILSCPFLFCVVGWTLSSLLSASNVPSALLPTRSTTHMSPHTTHMSRPTILQHIIPNPGTTLSARFVAWN